LGHEQVYQHLHQQGLKVTRTQVAQSAEWSGWQRLQATLFERYEMGVTAFHIREEWLVAQLLALVQSLLAKVEMGQSLTPEEHLTQNDIHSLAKSLELQPQTPFPAHPWMLQVEQVVFGQNDASPETPVCCPSCGCQEVKRKGQQPRWKKFYDQNGALQQTAVYRYSCPNPDCKIKSFTHFPDGLVPYSPYRTQLHLLALQMYSWGYSTYRRTGTALGVHSLTVWRWVSEWGHDLLPVAALFGILKSSGVVGVDEKYVLVPKNDKPEGDMRRWMYVYLAVDAWTYDLLHIAIYPYNNQDSATAFLLALRAKGYHPNVIVTDLRQDYGPVIIQVFPQAEHHVCIFHALQNAQKHIKEVYGPNYAQTHPEAEQLKQHIYAIFDTQSPLEAQQRYQHVLTLKVTYIQTSPPAIAIFDFLEYHWPKLLNAIGSDLIPTTNNTVELVIRRFDQHYQNFCGFDNLESAQRYLGVFEKIYRFTPFSQDAQPRIRGKSPLQLAGYNVGHLPMSAICSGLSVDWPTQEEIAFPN
jgi:transposase-like protein